MHTNGPHATLTFLSKHTRKCITVAPRFAPRLPRLPARRLSRVPTVPLELTVGLGAPTKEHAAPPTIRLCPCHLAHARASFARLLWYLAAPPRIPVARARLHANPVSTPSQSARSPVLPLEPDHTLSLPTAFLTYPDRPCSTPRLLGSPARLTCSAHLLDSPARLDSARLCARFTCSPRACHASRLLLSPAVPHLLGSPLLVSLRVLAAPVIFSVLFPRPTCSPARSPRLEHHSTGFSWRLTVSRRVRRSYTKRC